MLSKDKIIVFFRITGDFYKEFEFDMNKRAHLKMYVNILQIQKKALSSQKKATNLPHGNNHQHRKRRILEKP